MSLVKEYCSEESLKKSGLFENLKVVRLLNKLDKSDAASEFDEMALVGIISTQIIYKIFIEDFRYNYTESDTFDQFFDYRSVNEKLTKVV
jgi:asparagine synthase (glutamine-hydrolysing)